MDYRNLNENEISTLKIQGCGADDWSDVKVSKSFTTKSIRNVKFSGQVKLSNYTGTIEIEKGISKKCGLFNSYIQNCTIAGNVRISEVKTLANYNIESDVVIENVGTLVVNEETTFGNGTEIEVWNEGGGRELIIYDKLSSQIAYMIVAYRHNSGFIEKLQKMIKQYISTIKSDKGTIKKGTKIVNCITIRNVNIGEYACISGSFLLEEGTIGSCKEDPVSIGEAVMAKKFVILSGSSVNNGALLDNCFIGQGVKMGKQYSAENSAFFANCEGFHGEACSIYAGPYTVTHHKSTLLIAGMFSFFNAGSGSNQSNHMYKLGPLHQGVLERGSKTGSFSYMLWPCRIGAFTAIIGKHYTNFDVSDLPFSYILESGGKSVLLPSINLYTVGTRRDSAKWPARDRRKDNEKLDLIHFDLFNPYTIGKVVNGMKILKHLDETTPADKVDIDYKGALIKRNKLRSYYDNYKLALNIYIGNEVLKRIKGKSSLRDIVNLLEPKATSTNNWIDVSGMLATASSIEGLLKSVVLDKINNMEDLNKNIKSIYESYSETAWAWCADLISKQYNISIKDITPQNIITIINEWKDASIKFNRLILKDAGKEFDETAKIGFGIDGDIEVRNKDFEAIRGKFEEDKFVVGLKKEIEEIETKAANVIKFLN